MLLLQKLTQLERLDSLIRRRGTGNCASLAKKIGVSERTIYNLLDDLRSIGAEINYCRERPSYYYVNEVKFRFTLILSEDDQEKLNGGFYLKEPFPQFFCGNLI